VRQLPQNLTRGPRTNAGAQGPLVTPFGFAHEIYSTLTLEPPRRSLPPVQVIGALAQLRVAWRKEVSERARGVPATKRSRRGPVLAVSLLLIAAAVCGFALSQYLVRRSDHEAAALRGELQSQLARISATAERLERAAPSDHASSARVDDDRRAAEDVAVTTTLGLCRANGGAATDATPTCSEQEAQRVTLCGSVAIIGDHHGHGSLRPDRRITATLDGKVESPPARMSDARGSRTRLSSGLNPTGRSRSARAFPPGMANKPTVRA